MRIGSDQWRRIIRNGSGDFNIILNKRQLDQFSIHATELIKWNLKVNLTAITDPKAVAVKHFLDSLAPVKLIPPNAVLLDIGSGGGFPGLPLKVVMPSLAVTLIDASHKKVSFMRHMIRNLDLADIEALHIRADELAMYQNTKHSFDVIVSRALFDVKTFVSFSLPLLAEDGMMIIFKGALDSGDREDINKSVTAMQFEIEGRTNLMVEIREYHLPHSTINRSLVCIRRKMAEI